MTKTTAKKTTTLTVSPAVASANFEILASILIETAANEKALSFAEKIIGQARAKGAEWMAAHAVQLSLLSRPDELFCPVEDNRNFYMAELQMALIG